MLNLDELLSEAGEFPPCGPNLEHDLAFFELEEAARGKPEQSVGDTVKPGEDPDWAKVTDLARSLLARSKDLRLAIYLTRGLTRSEGFPGLADGLSLVHGLLERYWDAVHPGLEVDNNNDDTERLNALAPLADPETVIGDVRATLLVNSREHGALQARDLEVALGRLVPARSEAGPAVKPLNHIHAQIAAAFAVDRTVPLALGKARNHIQGIQALVAERATGGLDLKPLAQSIESLLEACDAALGTAAQTAADAAAEEAAAGVDLAGEVRTRDQALRALDLVCRYLERHEPSNPAPLFIRRAQRLMTKNFLEIMKDLMPDSLPHLEGLAGSKLDQT